MRRKSDRPPVVYLVAHSGVPNYGDELVAAGWLRHLAQTAPDAEVWLDTPRPGQTAVLLDGIHPGLRCVDTLFHACWNAPTDDAAAALAHGERVVVEPGLIPREASGVEVLARADVVHLLGGGYLNAMWPHHLTLVGAAAAMVARHGARAALTGAGLLPLVPGSVPELAARLNRFDVVDVRDEPSRAALAGAVPRTTLTGDDAVMALGGSGVYGAEGARRTMLSLQSDVSSVTAEQLADYVVRTLHGWGVADDPVTLVECMPPDDGALLQLLQSRLPQVELLPFARLWRSGFPAGPGQRWIATRFHAHLVAAAAGAWGVAVPVSEDYYRVKHASLTALGSGWALAADLDDPLPAGSAPAEPFGGRLAELRAAKRQVADRVTALARVGRAG